MAERGLEWRRKIQFHASEEKLCILYNNYMSYEEKGGFDIDQKVSKTHKKTIHKQPNQASKQAGKQKHQDHKSYQSLNASQY